MAASGHTFWPSLPNIGIGLQHCQCWNMHFGPTILGVFVALDIEHDSKRGTIKTWLLATIHMCLSSQLCKWHSTLPTLIYGFLVQMNLGESGYKI
jgi:hypothetical protein